MDNKIKELHKKASDEQFLINQKLHGDDNGIIDLHGLLLNEACEKLEESVEKWLKIKNKSKWIKIIAGAGNHSINGKKLFPALWNRMKAKGWIVKEGGNGWFYCKNP